jgi:arylsulfatase A-like enzyme
VRDYWDALPVYDAQKNPSGGRVPPLGRTVAHALSDRGYATAFFGKWHLAERDRNAPLVGEAHAKQIVPPERRGGFGLWEGFEGGFLLNDPWLHGTRLREPKHFKGYQADVLAERAGAWSKEQRAKGEAGGRPYFCVVSLEAPHPPYHALAPHVAEVKPAEVKLRANVPIDFAQGRPHGGEVERKAREELAGYYAHIEATDRAIGRLVAEVDLSETIVVFTSVHGDMHGSHGVFRKAWPYEESVRVPLLVRFPHEQVTSNKGQVTRGVSQDPVSLVDLPHMAVAWAEGREWVCKRDSAVIAMPAAMEIPLQCPEAWRGFRSARHKLVLHADGTPWMYFDLVNDPLEMKNLAGDPARAGEIEELVRLM